MPGIPPQDNERLITVPLIAEGNVLGAMCLQREGAPFTAKDLKLAEAFAAYAASTLRDAEAHEQLQREVAERRRAQVELADTARRQQQLIRAAQQLTTSIELDRVLVRIAHQARQISDSDAATILQLEADGHTLTPIVAIDDYYATELLASQTTIDASVTGAAIKAGHAVILNDLESPTPRFHVPGTSVDPETRVIAAPLITEKRVIGALCLNRNGAPYTQQELQLVEAFAAYATAVLRNARHHQQLHNTQEALRAEHDQSQRYLDIAGVIIMALDESLRVTMINRKGCALLGLDESEVLGREWLSLAVPLERHDEVRRALKDVLAGKIEPFASHENSIVGHDGSLHYIVWHNTQIVNDQGESIGILSSGTDISERVAAEENLQWEARLTAALSRLYRPLVAPDATIEDIAQTFLRESIALTESRFGYVTMIDSETQSCRMAVMNDALRDTLRTQIALDEDGIERYDDALSRVCRDGAGDMHEVIHSGTPPPRNDAAIPKNHVPIARYLRVPATLGDKLVGQIGLGQAPRDYTTRDREAIERISEYFALAIQRLEQAEALQIKAAQQQQLLETARSLNESLNLSHVLRSIGESARDLLQANGCTLYSLEPDGIMLKPLLSIKSPHAEQILATPLHVDHSLTGQGIKAGHGLIFNTPQEQDSSTQIPGTLAEQDERVIVAPFVAEGQTLGAMCLNRLGRDFSADDLALAETFASYATNAMRNAQRHQTLATAQEALSLSEARFRGVAEHGQDGLLIIENRRIVYVNARLREIFGFSGDNAPWLGIAPWLADGNADQFHKVRDQVLANYSQPFQVELRINHPDGGKRDIMARYTPLRNDDEVVGGFVMITDMTERMSAERRLRTSEERYRTVVESINDVIFTCDLDGTLRYISPVIKQVTGYPPEDWLGTPFCDWALPEERMALQAHLQIIISGQGQAHTFGIERRDGSRGILNCSCRLLPGHEGQPPTISGRLTDITEQLRLEERLRQSQKMETVGRLAGGVAHDFNNLLTVINGFSEMLLSSMPTTNDYRPDVQQIHEAGVRAADLVRRLLAFSRQQPIEATIVDVNEVVLGLAGMLPRIIGEQIEIGLETAASPSCIYADRGQLEQILINLAANARDAIVEDPSSTGSLTIRTLNRELDKDYVPDYLTASPGPYLCLEIRDTGSGMDARTRSRIFEPFFTTKEIDKGTGLGLAIVYGAVQEMSGCIDVETAPGQGTLFSIHLPLTQEQEACDETISAPTPISRSGQGHIIVIEDQRQVRHFTCQMLRHMGYTVIACSSAHEVLSLISSEGDTPPDLLLVDVIMPGLSGPELVTELLQKWPQTHILYMSGYAREQLFNQVQLGRQHGFLRKPFTLTELSEAVHDILHDR